MPDTPFKIGQRYPTRGGGWAVVDEPTFPGFWALHDNGVNRRHNADGAHRDGKAEYDLLPRPVRTIRLNGRGTWALFEDGEKVGMFISKERAEEWQRNG